MKKSLMKNNSLLNLMSKSLITLPTPVNISMWWNFGSMLGFYLMVQIISGLMLSMHYCPNINYAFESIDHIMKNVNYGYKIRKIHMYGASLFFICMYIHIARGIYYRSYNMKLTWISGTIIMILSMSAAFMGYILPWGQMSYWGATVITNLMSAIPIIGQMIVEWLWGGFSVSNPTLNRFYSLHFIIPLIIMLMVIIHLTFLHNTGSSNPMGTKSNIYKTYFHPYFTLKDMLGFILFSMIFMIIIKINPNMLKDNDNFIQANPMVTPIHIQPEWYFLFAYAILRSVPSKLGGVIALMLSIMILFMMIFMKSNFKTTSYYPFSKFLFWMFISSFMMLTWLGAQPIEPPFMLMSQLYSIMYFMFFLSVNLINKMEDNIMMNI